MITYFDGETDNIDPTNTEGTNSQDFLTEAEKANLEKIKERVPENPGEDRPAVSGVLDEKTSNRLEFFKSPTSRLNEDKAELSNDEEKKSAVNEAGRIVATNRPNQPNENDRKRSDSTLYPTGTKAEQYLGDLESRRRLNEVFDSLGNVDEFLKDEENRAVKDEALRILKELESNGYAIYLDKDGKDTVNDQGVRNLHNLITHYNRFQFEVHTIGKVDREKGIKGVDPQNSKGFLYIDPKKTDLQYAALKELDGLGDMISNDNWRLVYKGTEPDDVVYFVRERQPAEKEQTQ